MKTAWFGFVAACGVFALAGCHESTAPISTPRLRVTKLEAPTVIAPGSSVTVVLTVDTVCGFGFDRISETRSQSQVTLTAVGRNRIPPMGCLEHFEAISYVIQSPLPSRFTVVVNQPGDLLPLTAEIETGVVMD